MMTNNTIDPKSNLSKKAKKLMEAAYEYWEVYTKECGRGAVCWLENDNGHFVLFTRGEYKDAIMHAAHRETRDAVHMFDPFGKEGQL